jgi:hypothetical protein
MRLRFLPATKNFDDLLDAGHVTKIWQQIGETYLSALQELTGLQFNEKTIIVRCGKFPISLSGISGKDAMKIALHDVYANGRYEYSRKSDDEIIGLLTHELGHRLLASNDIYVPDPYPRRDYEVHRQLNIFLYDSWLLAFGQEQSQRIATYEHFSKDEHPELYSAWEWATTLTPEERKEFRQHLVHQKKFPEAG